MPYLGLREEVGLAIPSRRTDFRSCRTHGEPYIHCLYPTDELYDIFCALELSQGCDEFLYRYTNRECASHSLFEERDILDDEGGFLVLGTWYSVSVIPAV